MPPRLCSRRRIIGRFMSLSSRRAGSWLGFRRGRGWEMCSFSSKGAAGLPFLLRHVGLEDPDRFYLVGDAYIQGLMQGQSRELDLEECFILV